MTIPMIKATQITSCAHNASSAALIKFSLICTLVAKFSDHLSLYRKAQIFAGHGIDLDRSILASRVGRAC
jgi:transposase